MSKRLLTPALLSTILLLGCSTTPTIPAQPAGSPLKAVPCTEVPVIDYHAPKDAPSANAWIAGTLPDPQNRYDTPDTVIQVRRNNAARAAVCGP